MPEMNILVREMERIMMNAQNSIEMSRNSVLSLAAIFLWASMGGGALQFLLGNEITGALFVVIGVAAAFAFIEGRLTRFLIGRKVSKANILIMVLVLALVAGNETFSLMTIRSITGAVRIAQAVFFVGFLILVIILIWQLLAPKQPN